MCEQECHEWKKHQLTDQADKYWLWMCQEHSEVADLKRESKVKHQKCKNRKNYEYSGHSTNVN